jgi:hypothetical protein
MGNWSISVVDSTGDVGRFSSLALDTSDVPHISYYQHLTNNTGIVKLAVWNNTEWNITNVDSLYNVFIGFSGARNMTSLILDSQMNTHLTYNDQKIMKYANWDGSNWQRQIIIDVSGRSTILGQQTSMQLDNQGYVHIAYYEVTSSSPLTGNIMYVTDKLITDVEQETEIKLNFLLSQNYPNPFNPSTRIIFTIPTSPLNPSPYQGEGNRESFVSLIVYDVLGNEIATLVNEEKPPGTYEVTFNADDLTSGIYFYQLRAGNFVETKKMILLR